MLEPVRLLVRVALLHVVNHFLNDGSNILPVSICGLQTGLGNGQFTTLGLRLTAVLRSGDTSGLGQLLSGLVSCSLRVFITTPSSRLLTAVWLVLIPATNGENVVDRLMVSFCPL